MIKFDFLNDKEKRLAVMIVFVVGMIFTLFALVTSVVTCFQFLFDYPKIKIYGYGAMYDNSQYNTLICIFFALSLILSIVILLFMLFFKGPKNVSFILLGVNLALQIIFAIVLRCFLPSFNDSYPDSFVAYDYELFSTYLSNVLSINIPLYIAALAQIRLKKQITIA